MPRKKAIFYPRDKDSVPAFHGNASTQLDTGGVGAKYTIDPAKVANIVANDALIGPAVAAAEAAKDVAQEKNRIVDELYAQCKDAMMEVFTELNNKKDFLESDAELLGMRVFHEEPDWTTISPVIKRHQITDVAVEFYFEKGPSDGIIMFEAQILENTLPILSDEIQEVAHNDPVGLNLGAMSEVMRANHSPIRDTRKNRSNFPETRMYMFKCLLNDMPIGLPSPMYKVVVDFQPR